MSEANKNTQYSDDAKALLQAHRRSHSFTGTDHYINECANKAPAIVRIIPIDGQRAYDLHIRYDISQPQHINDRILVALAILSDY